MYRTLNRNPLPAKKVKQAPAAPGSSNPTAALPAPVLRTSPSTAAPPSTDEAELLEHQTVCAARGYEQKEKDATMCTVTPIQWQRRFV